MKGKTKMIKNSIQSVFVTGGAGYVGAVLIPLLLNKGYHVRVLDLFLFGDKTLDSVKNCPNLQVIKGDIRDQGLLKKTIPGSDAVIHLACVSNDPSFELNPDLSRTINYDAFDPLVKISHDSGVRRFVYASTCSVYGISDSDNVTEDHPLLPVTDYNKYKGLCEPVLREYQAPDFTTVIIRPATVCGYSPRQRLDLTVNTLTSHAWHNGWISVFGGEQCRPNIHIADVVELYAMLMELDHGLIEGKTFNAGYQNYTVAELATIVKSGVEEEMPKGKTVEIVTTPSDDKRSYRISSEKIRRDLGFIPKRTIQDATKELVGAFRENRIPNPMSDISYYNIKTFQHIQLT